MRCHYSSTHAALLAVAMVVAFTGCSAESAARREVEAGQRAWEMGDKLKARQHFDAAVERAPELVSGWQSRADLLTETGDYVQAIADYSTALRLAPGDVMLHSRRAVAYQLNNQHREAISDYDVVLAREPQLPYAWYNRGMAYQQLGDREHAVADLAEANRLESPPGRQ